MPRTCDACNEATPVEGHLVMGAVIAGKWTKFADGHARYRCQPEYAEAVERLERGPEPTEPLF